MSRRPLLLCYDGSEPAREAIARVAELTGGGPAIVACAWEAFDRAVVPVPGLGGIVEGGVRELNRSLEEAAQRTAAEGAELASAEGFDATPLAVRAPGRDWRSLLAAADEHDVSAIALGSRGRSAAGAAVLGSVAYALVHRAGRPVIVVPPAADRERPA